MQPGFEAFTLPARRRGAGRSMASAAITAVVLATAIAAGVPAVHAQAPAPAAASRYDIAPGTLDQVLNRFAAQAGVLIAIDASLTAGRTSPGLAGTFGVRDGFGAILVGSGLEAVPQPAGGYALHRALGAASGGAGDGRQLPVVQVSARPEGPGDPLPAAYAGGQVARGGRVGVLGNKDFLETPFSLTAYTSQLIEDQQARTIADMADNNPSLRMIYPDNDVFNDFAVRGNKLKALDAAYAGLYGMMSPGIESLERLEILSGANALLNGLGPVGGVGGSINQVPKRAGDTPLTRLTTGYISDSQWGVKADVSRRFGEDQRLGVRFNGAYSDGDTSTVRQSRTVQMASLGLDYRGERARVEVDLGLRRNDTSVPARTTYVLAGVAIPAAPKPIQGWQQPWAYDNTRATTAAVRGEYDLTPALTAFAAAGYSRFEEQQLFSNSFLTSSTGALTQSQVYWPLYRDNTTAEAGLRTKLQTGGIEHQLVASVGALKVRNGIVATSLGLTSTNIYNPVFVAPPSIVGLAGPDGVPRTGATDFTGVAVADTMSMLDGRLQFTLGLRHQSINVKNYSATTGAVLPPPYDRSVTTPGAGLVFKLQDNLSVYANYIEGLQQGATVSGGSNVGQTLAPFVSKQHEVGAKFDVGSWAVTAAIYQLRTPNGFLDTATNIYGINGEQRTRGLELNTFGEITRGVRLLGGVALVDARQTRTQNGTNNGKHVTGAPRVQFNLGGEVDVAAGLTLTARAIHTSSQYLDLANAQSIPSWTRYDAGARYRTIWNGVPTTVRLNVTNLLNKSYWVSAIDSYLVQSTPRTVQLSATFDF